MTIAELFSAGSTDWLRVNPKLRTYWHTQIILISVPLLIVATFVLVFAWNVAALKFIAFVVVGAIVVFGTWSWLLVTRRVRSIGYRIEERELKVSSGIMFRRVVSVPFARMQLVEVSAGPLERAFSLASVQLHTASTSTDATIPGLDPEQAAQLRDALASNSATAGL
jgi:membrane protein YdbS with pleckstrin-like domain